MTMKLTTTAFPPNGAIPGEFAFAVIDPAIRRHVRDVVDQEVAGADLERLLHKMIAHQKLLDMVERRGHPREIIEALVAAGERSLLVTREARTLAELDIDRALTSAAEDLKLLASAGAPGAGPCAIVLGALQGGARQVASRVTPTWMVSSRSTRSSVRSTRRSAVSLATGGRCSYRACRPRPTAADCSTW